MVERNSQAEDVTLYLPIKASARLRGQLTEERRRELAVQNTGRNSAFAEWILQKAIMD